jgi:hypothetical protein
VEWLGQPRPQGWHDRVYACRRQARMSSCAQHLVLLYHDSTCSPCPGPPPPACPTPAALDPATTPSSHPSPVLRVRPAPRGTPQCQLPPPPLPPFPLFSQVRYAKAEVTAIDPDAKTLQLQGEVALPSAHTSQPSAPAPRHTLPYDLLFIGVGGEAALPAREGGGECTAPHRATRASSHNRRGCHPRGHRMWGGGHDPTPAPHSWICYSALTQHANPRVLNSATVAPPPPSACGIQPRHDTLQ